MSKKRDQKKKKRARAIVKARNLKRGTVTGERFPRTTLGKRKRARGGVLTASNEPLGNSQRSSVA